MNMKNIKLLISLIPVIIITGLYSYHVVPYGWDKWMNSQNYSAGQFGQFICFTPIIVMLVLLGLQIVITDKIKGKKNAK